MATASVLRTPVAFGGDASDVTSWRVQIAMSESEPAAVQLRASEHSNSLIWTVYSNFYLNTVL